MKKLFYLSLLLYSIGAASCKKEPPTAVLIPGQQYNVKGDYLIFNKGAYSPQNPVKVIDLYVNFQGIPYAHINAPINWAEFALKPANGVADQTVKANVIIWGTLQSQGVQWGDNTTRVWDIPQWDLTN